MTQGESRQRVRVELGTRSYDIDIGPGLVASAGEILSDLIVRPRVFIITDETVAKIHLGTLKAGLSSAGVAVETFEIPPGEASKSFAHLEQTLAWLLAHGAGRDDMLIAFGGGVVGDLAGLSAALMKRGMTLVQVPTTLLAQVDSSVGGKTAINMPQGKNLVGIFYQPIRVLADTDMLTTLPERELRAGYAEIVKYGLIDDADFFEWLEDNGTDVLALEPGAIAQAVAVSCAAKARIVAADEREAGLRALLNLGHTFGHALEAANQYRPDLLHGEAVGFGLSLACRYSTRLGLMNESAAERARQVLEQGGLETRLSACPGGPYAAADLVHHMRQDKKARGAHVPLILTRAIG
ncbi:MAG: 3-dehydroquinate synthase, partial [Pseudomonadota bacterium]